MMVAWYFATALAKQYDAVLPFIEGRVLEPWTHNKAIQKAIESRRITPEQKEYLRSLKSTEISNHSVQVLGAICLKPCKIRREGEIMSTTILCYEKCSTCKKALKWMDEKDTPTRRGRSARGASHGGGTEGLVRVKSGLPLKRFFNTSGNLAKELKLKDRLPEMSEEEQIDLLASDGMLVKRPLLVTDKGVFPGFRRQSGRIF